MKRVKALIASAAVVAVVAGAVAFKAPTNATYYRLNPSTNNCNQSFVATKVATGGTIIQYNTVPSTGACPLSAQFRTPE